MKLILQICWEPVESYQIEVYASYLPPGVVSLPDRRVCALPEETKRSKSVTIKNYNMIINCPIYLEVDEKFTPQEGREFTLGIRKFVIDQIVKDTGGKFKVVNSVNNKILTVKILKESEAVARFGSRISKQVDNQPPEGKK